MGAILIVEDEPTVLMLAESILKDEGHQTLTAADLQQALAIVEADHPIDLLFTDIGLKEASLGGIELARETRRLRPETAVLYTTGQTVTDGMRELFVEGSDLLAKPYIASDLTGTVAKMLQGCP
jgi:CheY-like chemotaxis protein